MPYPPPPLIPLTPEQRDLAAEYFSMALRIGDEAARRYPGLSDEVRCAAVDGLLKAVRKFDGSMASLSTWVDHVCWQSILTELKHWRDSPFDRHREGEASAHALLTPEPEEHPEFSIPVILSALSWCDAELFRLHVLEKWTYKRLVRLKGVNNRSLASSLRRSRDVLRKHPALAEYAR